MDKKFLLLFVFLAGLAFLTACSQEGVGTGILNDGGRSAVNQDSNPCGSGIGSSVAYDFAVSRSHYSSAMNCFESECGRNDDGMVIGGTMTGAVYTDDDMTLSGGRWTVSSSVSAESVTCDPMGGSWAMNWN